MKENNFFLVFLVRVIHTIQIPNQPNLSYANFVMQLNQFLNFGRAHSKRREDFKKKMKKKKMKI